MNKPYSKKKRALLQTEQGGGKPDYQERERSYEVDYKININTADDKELLNIFKSKELVWAVKSGRPYNSVEELYRVEGIDEDLFKKIEGRVMVEDLSEPGFMGVVEVRESKELQEGVIPGLDMDEQEEITGARDLLIAERETYEAEAKIQQALGIETSSELEQLDLQEKLPDEEILEEDREIIPGCEVETIEAQRKAIPEPTAGEVEDETVEKPVPGRKSRLWEEKSDKKYKKSAFRSKSSRRRS